MSNFRHTHGIYEIGAREGELGLMTPELFEKLNSLVDVAEIYTHPTTDGNKHVPVTGTTNDGKVLKAGATAGVFGWADEYAHPIGDGNLHVPETSTTNSGKVLTAGETAGSLSWETVTNLPVVNTAGLALFNDFIAGGTDGQTFTMNSDGTGSWKTIV